MTSKSSTSDEAISWASTQPMPEPAERSQLLSICQELMLAGAMPAGESPGPYWCIRLPSQGELVGAILLESSSHAALAGLDLEPVRYFTAQLAAALKNLMLQHRAQEREKELTCLFGILKLLARPGIALDTSIRLTVKCFVP